MPKPNVAWPSWMVSPVGWGAQVAYDQWSDRWVPKDKIAVHYGGGANTAGSVAEIDADQISDAKAVLRSWERFHITGRGWRGIAYNFAVGQSGTVYRLRGWNLNGGHYGTDDIDYDGISANSESLACVFILGGDQKPTAKAKQGFERLRGWLQTTLAVPSLPLYGHKEIAASGGHSTSCPGPHLMAYVEAHRESTTTPPTRFWDVPANHPHYGDIEWLADRGITEGCAPDRYCPDEPVTRAQLATFLRRYHETI